MERSVKLPQISEGSDSGIVSEIYVSEGDRVEAEESIIAVESDKATVDVPVEEGGTVKSVDVSVGDEISAGDVLITLEVEKQEKREAADRQARKGNTGDDAESVKSKENGDKEKEPEDGQRKQKERKKDDRRTDQKADHREPEEAHKKKSTDGDKVTSKGSTEKEELSNDKSTSDVPAAPLAKKFARELGIQLEDLKTNDPEQRVTTHDVFAFAKDIMEGKASKERNQKQDEVDLPDFSQWGETEREPMSGIRRSTAAITGQSWSHIPHVTHFDDADITELENFRKSKALAEGITLTSILLKIAGEGLKLFSKFNASLDLKQKEVVYKKYISVAVAVDTERGLLMPVLRDVDQKSINELSEELSELSAQARAGKLESTALEGGNFAISNLGGIGGTAFTPVIYPPQVCILGVAKASQQAIFSEGKFEPRLRLPLALSYDHRLIDGADAARFVRWICTALEQPLTIFLGRKKH